MKRKCGVNAIKRMAECPPLLRGMTVEVGHCQGCPLSSETGSQPGYPVNKVNSTSIRSELSTLELYEALIADMPEEHAEVTDQ